MASTNWSSQGERSGRSNTLPQRSRSGHEAYPSSQSYLPEGMYTMRSGSSPSSMTSSLSGAIGETVHRSSRSPPVRSDSLYNNTNWTTTQPTMLQGIQSPSYIGVAGMNSLAYDITGHSLHYDSTTMRDSSPDSISSASSSNVRTSVYDHYSQQSLRQSGPGYSLPALPTPHSISVEDQLQAELLALRQKLREAEVEAARYRAALEEARAQELAHGLPTPPPTASFQQDWKSRTEVRKKMFCSLNRAGNALCAWHDSRRERRSFPPRNAPPGYLNCGCTCEEALFEESLSRHGIGSYYPGESVRMDPALRNPLLKLLQQRYGYQDGDFERNPTTGDWLKGEGAALWEARAHSGSTSRRRVEVDRQ